MRAATADEHADHYRDSIKHEPNTARDRMLSVAYLTGYLDTMLRMDMIPADCVADVRATINQTRKRFDLTELPDHRKNWSE